MAALKETEAVPVFAALADGTRLRLLGRLSVEGPLSITRLTEGTVKVYLHNIFEKLGVSSRTELAIRADEFLAGSYLDEGR